MSNCPLKYQDKCKYLGSLYCAIKTGKCRKPRKYGARKGRK